MTQDIDRVKRKRLLSFLSEANFGIGIEEHRVQLSTQSLSRYGRLQELTEHCQLLKNLSW
ncbi:hypothetical protein [Leuconostoc citreum]|uniref:hypothetical protein n=1 Tax=Leuconostoc citreum TaxID=33964 RepID=UPI0021A2BE06|nr:hypothetical protein [Leuconostoc citreum]